jgi:hypothetical protein
MVNVFRRYSRPARNRTWDLARPRGARYQTALQDEQSRKQDLNLRTHAPKACGLSQTPPFLVTGQEGLEPPVFPVLETGAVAAGPLTYNIPYRIRTDDFLSESEAA